MQHFVGTTWLQEIVWRLLNKNSQESDLTVWNKVPLIESTVPGSKELYYDIVQQMKSPRMFKSHLPVCYFKEQIQRSECKCIVIMRNPKDTLVSFYHFARSRYPNSDFNWQDWFDKFRSKSLQYGDWFEHVNGWWNLKDQLNILFIKYEDLKLNHGERIQKIAKFLNICCTEMEIDSITKNTSLENMKSNPKTNLKTTPGFYFKGEDSFIRKGEIGDWTNYFTSEQNKYIEERIENELKMTDLSFQYK